MTAELPRVLLDTNVFIIGAAAPKSAEGKILEWANFGGDRLPVVEILISEALIAQILRVAQRLRHKDWGGEMVARIWQNMPVQYVLLDPNAVERLQGAGSIPREDVEIYLTAKMGRADYFISSNRELVRTIAEQRNAFRCLLPEEFVDRFLTG